jgi:hypothetical protein
MKTILKNKIKVKKRNNLEEKNKLFFLVKK